MLQLIVEIARRESSDAIYCNCDNPDPEDYISNKGFKTDYETFSDILVVTPASGIAAVNLSSGYYNTYQLHEYINRAELEATISKVKELVEESTRPDFPKYKYMDAYRFLGLRGFWRAGIVAERVRTDLSRVIGTLRRRRVRVSARSVRKSNYNGYVY